MCQTPIMQKPQNVSSCKLCYIHKNVETARYLGIEAAKNMPGSQNMSSDCAVC